MRNPARGPFRAFLTLSNEFARHPDYRWYTNNIMFNLAQLTRQCIPADMREDLRRMKERGGTLSTVAERLLLHLPPRNVYIDLLSDIYIDPFPVSEWALFKSCVYAMVNVMTTERNETWMNRFKGICTNLCAHPQYMDQLQGRPTRAVEFVRLAKAHVQFKCYCQSTKRALSALYLNSCMCTSDETTDTTPLEPCSVCMKRVRKRHVRLPCGHVFHKVCMLRWMCKASRFTCPVCRQTLHV